MMIATPDEAEQAFYDAFNRGSLDAMREVWLDDDCIVCIHPRGQPLSGRAAVIGSWEQLLRGPGSLEHEVRSRCQGPLLAVHTGVERLPADGGRVVELAVTNVFQLTGAGWRMLLHHASPASAQPVAPAVH